MNTSLSVSPNRKLQAQTNAIILRTQSEFEGFVNATTTDQGTYVSPVPRTPKTSILVMMWNILVRSSSATDKQLADIIMEYIMHLDFTSYSERQRSRQASHHELQSTQYEQKILREINANEVNQVARNILINVLHVPTE